MWAQRFRQEKTCVKIQNNNKTDFGANELGEGMPTERGPVGSLNRGEMHL